MNTCANCRFWDRYDDDHVVAARSKGDCRRRPPRVSDAILGLRDPEVDDIDDRFISELYLASAFPVTHETSWCGEHDDGRREVPI
jgi:hypothetical protein